MVVNTNIIKTFAPAMRRQLIDGVGRKLDLLINTKTPDTLTTYAKQIKNLQEKQHQNREQLIEKVAYTWFNRLCALRFLDAKNWHPFSCRVLMPAEQGETQPELLKLMRSGSLPTELKRFTDEQRLNNLLDNQIPTALKGGDPQAEVYRELIMAACRSYHHLLPDLFEAIDDETELLLPDDLLTENSIAGSFRKEISDSDCEDVEIIGWLYQFYISEKKEEVIGKVVKSEDIPAATQLFTPNWIVKYMVQNTIGAKWLATYPDSSLREQMEFYVEPAAQSDEIKSKRSEPIPTSLNPEELTLMDPACGSGHILVEAYNIFRAIYLEQGYQKSEIPELILTKNLYGLDICPRAAQLATFSLLMKCREDDRRLFEKEIIPNIHCLHELNEVNIEIVAASTNDHLDLRVVSRLVKSFKNIDTVGSLIKHKPELAGKIAKLSSLNPDIVAPPLYRIELSKLKAMASLTKVLNKTYDNVVVNPPYSGSRYLNSILGKFIKSEYPEGSGDLFAAFISRAIDFAKPMGRISLLTPFVWMYVITYEKIRKKIYDNGKLQSLIKLEYNSFEPACVPVCTWTLVKDLSNTEYESTFIDLKTFKGHELQPIKTLEAIKQQSSHFRYSCDINDFLRIPGAPFAFNESKEFRKVFELISSLGDKINITGSQNITGKNELFVRKWWEVSLSKIGPDCKWVMYAKGGGSRKWWGMLTDVVDWSSSARKFYAKNKGSNLLNEDFWYKKGITYSELTSNASTFRIMPKGCLYDKAGPAFHSININLTFLLGLVNSSIATKVFQLLNPTIHLQTRDIKNLPFPNIDNESIIKASEATASCIKLSKRLWDLKEISTDFQNHSLLDSSNKNDIFKDSFFATIVDLDQCKLNLAENEHNCDQKYSEIYGIDLGIQNCVVTKEKEDVSKEVIRGLISYFVGLCFGRYSLDHPGLILADYQESQEIHLTSYEAKVGKQISDIKFKPDLDGIIPVLEGEWFEDDIVALTREFIAVTFPESSVAENLRFIENSIGKDIRKYFCRDFYKDHLQTYKKRPIYWMVQSPNAGFACLIYLHRYTPETLLQVLNDYFRPYLQKLEARLTLLDLDQVNDSLSKREQIAARKEAEKINKVIKECQDWEKEALLPLAQKRIKLDLDDGVKVNYLKLQDVLAKIPGLKAKGKK